MTTTRTPRAAALHGPTPDVEARYLGGMVGDVFLEAVLELDDGHRFGTYLLSPFQLQVGQRIRIRSKRSNFDGLPAIPYYEVVA